MIGLVGACENNPKTSDTDRLVIKALAFPQLSLEHDDRALAFVSCDRDEADLLEILDEAEKMEQDIKTGGIQNG